MKNKKMIILGLIAAATLFLGAVPVKADALPVQNPGIRFTDEQVRLAQANWNAYVEMTKAQGDLANAFAGQITTLNPDSLIAKTALIHHFAIVSPDSPAAPTALQPGYNTAFTNNPYFDYYPFYYCTYQYR